ncbi:HPA3 [Candida pseudojiufengensis]|uniref:HPA3 n=1 Tax=Candida pseudojiufengensis TaxID=497109 RepID=UPI002223FDBE|nr:HPA3 [Candida pseudojiufengensis]KAI5960997.1 HPA3 [Candida pseudojiufengensis]
MSVVIRPIEAKDKEEWVNLWTGPGGYIEFYKSLDKITPEITNTTFERFLDSNDPTYCNVAIDSSTNKIIGFATYLTHRNTWTIEDSCYLNDLFVCESNRLGGVGRKLINSVYEDADKLGCGKTYWHTQFENHRAQLLYTKVGVKDGFLKYSRPE